MIPIQVSARLTWRAGSFGARHCYAPPDLAAPRARSVQVWCYSPPALDRLRTGCDYAPPDLANPRGRTIDTDEYVPPALSVRQRVSPVTPSAPSYAYTRASRLPLDSARPVHHAQAVTWAKATPRSAHNRAAWSSPPPRTTETAAAWARCSRPQTRTTRLSQAIYLARTGAVRLPWRESARHIHHRVALAFRQSPPLTVRVWPAWVDALRVRPNLRRSDCYQPPPGPPIIRQRACGYSPPDSHPHIHRDRRIGTAQPMPRQLNVQPIAAWVQGQPSHSVQRVVWGRVRTLYPSVTVEDPFVWPVDPDTDPVVVPYLEAYYVHHSIAATILPDDVHALLEGQATIRWSMAEAAATFSGTLVGRTGADQIKVPAGDDPKIIRLEINGETLEFLAATWTESESFNKTRASVTAYSRSYLLGSKFYLPESHVELVEHSMASLAEAQVPDDWSLIWTAASWYVPPGTFSYVNLTPLQVVGRLATAAGAYVECDDTAKTIRVKRIVPLGAEPWNIDPDSTTPDVQIPAVGLVNVERPMGHVSQANRVYVAGGENNGVHVEATITGTDGQLVAQQVNDGLMCHEDGARARAVRELAKYQAPPPITGFTAPFGGDFPLLRPGQIVKINFSGLGSDVIGIVTANALSVNVGKRATRVLQRVTLGEQGTTNAFKRLVNLNALPLEIATVSAVHSNGTVTVGWVGGGSARVRALGSEQVGDNVFIRGMAVEAMAQDLGAPLAILV